MDLDGRRGIGTGKKDSVKREAGNEPRETIEEYKKVPIAAVTHL